ncbi:hypothetical protein D9M72_430400 [compost metagenome]
MRPIEMSFALRPDDMKHVLRSLLLTPRQHEEFRRCEVRCGASLVDLNEGPHPDTQREVRRRAFRAYSLPEAMQGAVPQPFG